MAMLFRNERPLNHKMMKFMVDSSLETLHISCYDKCLETVKSTNDFIGICVLHEDGRKILRDNGIKVKSGYIFVARSSFLFRIRRILTNSTLHLQTYNKIFKNILHFDGVTIVGFSQQDKVFKAKSGTFNKDKNGELNPDDSKGCLFFFSTLIFGAIIMYKLTGIRNIKPKVATLGVCEFLINKYVVGNGQLIGFPLSDLEIEDKDKFLEEMFKCFDLEDEFIEFIRDYHKLDIFTKQLKVKKVTELVMENLSKLVSEKEFRQVEKGIEKFREKSQIFFTHVDRAAPKRGMTRACTIRHLGHLRVTEGGTSVGPIRNTAAGSSPKPYNDKWFKF